MNHANAAVAALHGQLHRLAQADSEEYEAKLAAYNEKQAKKAEAYE